MIRKSGGKMIGMSPENAAVISICKVGDILQGSKLEKVIICDESDSSYTLEVELKDKDGFTYKHRAEYLMSRYEVEILASVIKRVAFCYSKMHEDGCNLDYNPENVVVS